MKSAGKIPVIADVPRREPGLGFREYAEAIADAVRGGEPPQFTIGVYGPWGSGKSSLLNAIADNLESEDTSVIPVRFDAWRHERAEHIIVPILHAIYDSVCRRSDPSLMELMKKAISAVVFSSTFSLDKVGMKVSLKDVKEYWEGAGITELDDAFSKPFSELSAVSKNLNKRRIVVLIDDLDRCSSEKVVSVLESINLVMDVPGIIFILALDYDVLVSAISAKYPHVSGDLFIQKMVQIPFRVPALTLDGGDFMSELVPNWAIWKSNVPKKFQSVVRDVAKLGLDLNPRQVKRLINSFLLIQTIAIKRNVDFDVELMIALIGVQLQWPAIFTEFQDAVLSDQANPLSILLRDENDADLIRYSRRFFKKSVPLAEIRSITQFTAVVAVEESSGVAPRASELREANRATIEMELVERGFKKKIKTSRIYYTENNKDVRIAFTKQVVRLERFNRQDWELWNSYLLTTGHEALSAVLASPANWYSGRTR